MAVSSESNHGVVNTLIVDALQRPGWSQARLARVLDKRPQTINKWVSGENTPRVADWTAIEQALELEPGTFIRAVTGAGEPSSTLEGRPAAMSGIDWDDFTEEEQAQIRGYADAIKAQREPRSQ